MLYPLKFKPRYKERIWGGDALHTKLGRKIPKDKPIGESWELSAVNGDLSVVAKGPLAGNNIEELTEVYMGDLVGDRIYEKFGLQFPLLIKLIDAQDKLSIQVHPDDRLAAERHDSFGKTEMWYLLDCDKDAELYCGFSREVSREEYLRHVKAGTMADILEREKVKPGDAFFIPAGTVHAIGKGCLIAEIQQTSDITYRIFDWNRTDDHGHARELHTDLALDAIDFGAQREYDITPKATSANTAVQFADCPYFTADLVNVDGSLERDHYSKDSFVIYLGTEGDLTLNWEGGKETLGKGECILVPACMDAVTLSGKGKTLEVYIRE